MSGWTRRDLADFEWRMIRDQAEQATCPRCQAEPGVSCRNPITGDKVSFPAHFQRIDAAKEQR